MATTGPRPTPTALRILQGNPSRRPLPTHEAKPEGKLGPPPPHLDDEAKREWRRMGKRLLLLGLMTEIDRAEFASYCVSWSRWIKAEDYIRRFGLCVQTPQRMLIQSPYVSIANRAMLDMRAAAASFGMTPSSRSRVQAGDPPRQEDKDSFEAKYG